MAKLFPPYLNEGSKGAAPLFLQGWLQGVGADAYELDLDGLRRDGEYGPATAKLIKGIQQQLSVTPDGNLGPETRKEIADDLTPMDFNAIEAAPGEITMWAGPDHEGLLPWPPPETNSVPGPYEPLTTLTPEQIGGFDKP